MRDSELGFRRGVLADFDAAEHFGKPFAVDDLAHLRADFRRQLAAETADDGFPVRVQPEDPREQKHAACRGLSRARRPNQNEP